MSFCLLLLLSLVGGEEPIDLTVEADHKVLLKGIPFLLTIEAGSPDFTGEVTLSGVRDHTSVLLVKGRWEGTAIADAPVSVSWGGQEWKLDRRVIPGWLSILPPILAILLALLTREVFVALFGGLWLGHLLVLGFGPVDIIFAAVNAVESSIRETFGNIDHGLMILFVLMMGGMIGIMTASGGTKGFSDKVSQKVRTRRGGMIATWIFGLFLFIDDYASCLTLGNSMRPLTDRLRISREKLAYIIDSTAAPMATIGLVSTWIVFETDLFVRSGVITQAEAFSTFLHIVPYSFYAIFAVLFVFLISVTGRDFGPMRKAEERTVHSGQVSNLEARPLVDREVADVIHLENLSNRWLNVVLPILSFLVTATVLLYFSGKQSGSRSPDETSFWQIVGHAHTQRMIFWGSVVGCLVAMGLAIFRGHLGVRQTIVSWYQGCRGMFLAVMVLILAWSMANLCFHLSTGLWLESQIHHLLGGNWLPAITFVVCAFLSFATGSSWATMAIMAGIVAPIAWTHPELGVHYGTLAAVLSGSVFGDHISPISDTTIISSIGAAADHVDHVKTQAPYGLVCALVALGCGFIPAGFGVSPWISLPVGMVVLWILLTLLGKKLQVAHDLV